MHPSNILTWTVLIKLTNLMKTKICIVGLGYIGLPLFIELSKSFYLIGYDKSLNRVNQLNNGFDINNEFKKIRINKNCLITSDDHHMKNCDIFIITVPTPIKKNLKPDLKHICEAGIIISKYLKKKTIIILESTVYPGLTENYFAPLIEKHSKLKYNQDFYLAYCPERINPGDKNNTIKKINKVISSSDKKINKVLFKIYRSVTKGKILLANSIKVAETSKIIENTQRDINIAFINEVMIFCQRFGINVYDVLKSANTKWNFLNFSPGLVGGHCISVDPYYFKNIANSIGVKLDIVTASRKLNRNMYVNIYKEVIKISSLNNLKIKKILFLGCTFKENCSDLRNSQALELFGLFNKNKFTVDILDQNIQEQIYIKKYNIKDISYILNQKYDLIVSLVGHNHIKKFIKNNSLFINSIPMIYDFKNLFKKNKIIFFNL